MDMRKCILTCLECHRICIETMAHGLARGGPYVDNRLIQTLSDCADICHTSASFMMRQSDMHTRICGVCANVCDRCAHDCDGFKDDEQMAICVAICRQCAQSCRDMTRLAA